MCSILWKNMCLLDDLTNPTTSAMGNIACLERLDDTFCGPRAQKFLAPTPRCKKKCESSGSNKFQFVRTIWKLKTTESQLHYSESLHKIPMLGVVLKGACAHAPKWGMKRKLSTFSIMWSTTSFGKDEIASAHPKTLPFFPSNLQWPRCHYKVSMQVANVFFSQRMNQTHSVFNAQLHPKRSYQLDYGSWLSTKSQAGKR